MIIDLSVCVRKIPRQPIRADVVELVDTPDLGSGASGRGSSSLPIRTIFSPSSPPASNANTPVISNEMCGAFACLSFPFTTLPTTTALDPADV